MNRDEFYASIKDTKNYIYHHGIKGQKWGVRRYQNPDGTLTFAGKKHIQTRKEYNFLNEYSNDYINAKDPELRDLIIMEYEDIIRDYKLSNSYSDFVKKPIDIVAIKSRSGVDDDSAVELGSLGNKKFEEASKLEPKITKDIVDSVSESGGKMYGLEYRLKQPSSIAGKIGSDAKNDNLSVEDAYKGIKDAIRYTSVSEDDDFVNNYYMVKKSLEDKGYTETKCKNYFDLYQKGQVLHKSVQSTFKNEDGYEFELQFQTPASQAVKDLKTPIYEERRSSGIGKQRAAELDAVMKEMADFIPNPENIFDIESHK